MISTVFYLHEHWQEDWGGQLRLQDKNDQWHIIQPRPIVLQFSRVIYYTKFYYRNNSVYPSPHGYEVETQSGMVKSFKLRKTARYN